MDLEVVGCHALLFDDDSNASFVNSANALVEWNSLSIDRYDVRHLLSAPPPRIKRRYLSPLRHPDSPAESELDHERYLDLPSTFPEQEQDFNNGVGSVNDGGFHAVPFSYGNTDETNEQRNDTESGFQPPFSVPESLLQNLPPSEKVHQIIARTAMFVSKHGGQTEIILRVKQGDNPTFGFLMPHHHLHAYFRFLVDHPELLREENKTSGRLDLTSNVGGGGALSLLGSVYGSGEDEDGATEDTLELKRNESDEGIPAANCTVLYGSEQRESSVNVAKKDEKVSKHSLASLKEKPPLIKRNQSISTAKAKSSSGTKKESDASGSLRPAADKSEASALPRMPKVELPLVEPPSDIKRVVDKIVEFILRNGKEFEAILVEQDHKHGRFPFLLQSNLYYPYYLKVLHKAEESKSAGKGFAIEKHDSTGLGMEKKNSISKESSNLYLESNISYDSDRKEKFKMVIGKSKKDAQDIHSKPIEPNSGITMDADAAAAILQAATRGIRNPDLENLRKTSLIGNSQGPSSEGGQASSLGSLLSSWSESSKQKLDQQGEPSVSVPVANVIAKSAAAAAASEADSSDACLSTEQKLKAERLKRAKMFAAMIKSKDAPLKNEPRCQSVEPPEFGCAKIVNLIGKEREGSSVPVDVHTFDINEQSGKKDFAEDIERRSRRKYRSRSARNEEEEEEKEEEEEEKKDHKHSKRRHRSHRSSHHGRERKRHSSSKDRNSRHCHKHDSTADNEHRHSGHCQKCDCYSDEEHRHYRHRHKYDSSSDAEHSHSKHWRKHDSSSDDELRHQSRSRKHRKRSHSRREVELEEGEIKSDQSKASEGGAISREASVDVSKSNRSREASMDLLESCQGRSSSSRPSNTDEVSDDLRAKIRAMLMATL